MLRGPETTASRSAPARARSGVLAEPAVRTIARAGARRPCRAAASGCRRAERCLRGACRSHDRSRRRRRCRAGRQPAAAIENHLAAALVGNQIEREPVTIAADLVTRRAVTLRGRIVLERDLAAGDRPCACHRRPVRRAKVPLKRSGRRACELAAVEKSRIASGDGDGTGGFKRERVSAEASRKRCASPAATRADCLAGSERCVSAISFDVSDGFELPSGCSLTGRDARRPSWCLAVPHRTCSSRVPRRSPVASPITNWMASASMTSAPHRGENSGCAAAIPEAIWRRSDAESMAWRGDLRRTLHRAGPPFPWTRIPGQDHRARLGDACPLPWPGLERIRDRPLVWRVTHHQPPLSGSAGRHLHGAQILPPWSENAGKRLVKSPKLYSADTGLLHHLLGIRRAVIWPTIPRWAPRSKDLRSTR